MKNRNTRIASVVRFASLGIAMALATASGVAVAGPQNPNVIHGQATFQQNGNVWQIQTTNGTIIEYSSFNIGGAQFVQFLQTKGGVLSSNSSVLNRITGNAPTQIDGTLTANGIVYFVNPNGIVFGNNSVVNVGRFYAVGGDIDNDDFLNNNNTFTGLTGDVINFGHLQAKEAVGLFGRQVANHGLIRATNPDGVIMMGASDDTITIVEGADGRYILNISTAGAPGSIIGAGVENTGTLQATGSDSQIVLGAGDIYSMAIRMSETNHDPAHGPASVQAGGEVRFQDPVTLGDTDVTIQADLVEFMAGVEAEHTANPADRSGLTIMGGTLDGNAVAGDAHFGGSVGAGTELRFLDIDGASLVSGDIFVLEDVRFGGEVDFDGAGLQTVNAGGQIIAEDNVIKTSSGELRLEAGTIILGGALIQTTDGDLRLIGAAQLTGGMTQELRAQGGQLIALAIDKSGAGNLILFGDDGIEIVGNVTVQDGSLFVESASDIVGNVIASVDVNFNAGGAVTGDVEATSGTAFFADNFTVDGNVLGGTSVQFLSNGTVTGDVTAQSGNVLFGTGATVGGDVESVNQSVIFDGTSLLGGNVTAGTNVVFNGAVTFDGAGLQHVQAVGQIIAEDNVIKTTSGELHLEAGMILLGGALVQTADGNLRLTGNAELFGSGAQQLEAQGGQLIAMALDKSGQGNLLLFGDQGIEIVGNVSVLNGSLFVHNASDIMGDVMASLDVSFLAGGQVTGDVEANAGTAFFADNFTVIGSVVAGNSIQFLSGGTVTGNVTAQAGNVLFGTGATVGGDVEAMNQNVVFQGSALLGGNVSAGGNVAFNGLLTLDGAGDQHIQAVGQIIAEDNIIKTTSGDLVLEAGSILLGGALVQTDSGDLHLLGNASLFRTGDQQLHAQGGQLVTLVLNKTGQGNLLLMGDHGIEVAGNITVQNGSLFVHNASDIIGNVLASVDVSFLESGQVTGNVEASSGTAFFADNFSVDGNVYGGINVHFLNNGTVTGNATAQTGNLLFGSNGTVGGHASAGQSATFGNNAVIGNGVSAGAGNVLLGQNANVTGNAQAGTNVIVGSGGQISGNVEAGQNVEMLGSVLLGGNVEAGNNITFNGLTQFDGAGNQFVQAGNQLIIFANLAKLTNGQLILGAPNGLLVHGNTSTAGGDLIFEDDVEFVGTGTHQATAQGGQLIFLGSLTKGGGTLNLSGQQGAQVHGTIDGGFSLLVEAANGDVYFGGNIGQSQALASFETLVHNGVLVFDGNLVHAVGDILLNGNVDLVVIPTLATIGATGDLSIISQNGNVTMGQGQKLTVLGDLLIQAMNGTASLSDINTLGDLIVDAGEILLLTREPSQLVNALGEVIFDQGLDFVAGGQFFFSVTPIVVGNGPPPQFANPNGDGDALGTLQGFVMRVFGEPVTADMLVSGGSLNPSLPTFFDLRAQGPATEDLADALAAEVPRDEERGEVSDEAQLSADEIEVLRAIGVDPRFMRPDEMLAFAEGRGIYLDGTESIVAANLAGPRHQISIARLQSGYARRLGETRSELLFEVDPETGRTLPRAPELRVVLTNAWFTYIDEVDEPDPAGFGPFLRSWVADRPEDEVRDELAAIDAMERMHLLWQQFLALGFVPREAREFMEEAVYEQVRPDELEVADLRRAVENLQR